MDLRTDIKVAILKNKTTQRKIAEDLGISQQAVASWIDKGEVPKKHWDYVRLKLGVDPLDYIQPSQYIPPTNKQFDALHPTERISLAGADQESFTPVRKVSTSLSAGNGMFVHQDGFKDVYHFRTEWLFNVCQPNHAILFDVDGDSMAPTIKDKDTVLVDRSKVGMVNDKIFALRVGSSILVKRLRLRVSGEVEVINDNSNKEDYPTIIRGHDEIEIMGQVIWRGGVV